MPKKMDKPLEVVTIKLFLGDKETLGKFYPAPLGYNAAIRQIVNHHCNKLREAESRQGGQSVGPTSIEFDASDLIVSSAAGTGDS